VSVTLSAGFVAGCGVRAAGAVEEVFATATLVSELGIEILIKAPFPPTKIKIGKFPYPFTETLLIIRTK
jgi:hypothetical protein